MTTPLPQTAVQLPTAATTGAAFPGSIFSAMSSLEYRFVGKFANSGARGTAVPSPQRGQMAWLDSPGRFEYYDGAAWQVLFDPTGWTTWNPALTAGGGPFSLGSGSSSVGRYYQFGKSIMFQMFWQFGTTGISGNGGQISFALPKQVAGYWQNGSTLLYCPNQGVFYPGIWNAAPNSSSAGLVAVTSFDNASYRAMQQYNSGQNPSAGTGIPVISAAANGGVPDYPLQNNGSLSAWGVYETS